MAGISGHNGWAVFVCIAVRDGRPVVIDRRRVPLIDPGLPNQPYEHDTLSLDAARAEELVKDVQESAMHCAERGLARLRSSVGPAAEIVAVALREPPLPHLPESVAAVHASYPVMCRADSMLYHDATCKGASALGIAVELVARGKELACAAKALRTEVEDLDRWLAELRGSVGPPWQKDHRDAAARAIVALSKYAEFQLPG